MQRYHGVDVISAEIGVSAPTLYKKCKEIGIDPSKITDARKKKLIKYCADTIQRKKEAKAFMEDIQNVNVRQSDVISVQSGSTLEKRLSIAKQEFDNVAKSLAECQLAIDTKGTIIMNGNTGTISSNPAVKTKCELLKQFNALQKTIQELEEKMKLSTSTSPESPIDD